MGHVCSQAVHDLHIAAAVNAFRTECGDEDTWTPQESRWHDLLLQRIDREDGYTDHCQCQCSWEDSSVRGGGD